jgi:hypothetical protein
MKAASGLARAATPIPNWRRKRCAWRCSGRTEIAQSVVLYLSSDFAHDPQAAIAAAARAGQCTQVVGCTAAGVFTETDWVLDAPAAAALVLGEGVSLQPARPTRRPVLTYCAPNALDLVWLQSGGRVTAAFPAMPPARGRFRSGRNARANRWPRRVVLNGARLQVDFSQGVHPLTATRGFDKVAGHDVQVIGGIKALPAWRANCRSACARRSASRRIC